MNWRLIALEGHIDCKHEAVPEEFFGIEDERGLSIGFFRSRQDAEETVKLHNREARDAHSCPNCGESMNGVGHGKSECNVRLS